ncbi:MAG: hypothetical protein IPM37_21375 [Hahellaceae bacterium]|jgi:negative regulator of sigma E activity|nr:hypothetical protein [Hahellaceae bacterium]
MKEKEKVILSAMLDDEATEREIQRILGQAHDAEIHAYWQRLIRQRSQKDDSLSEWASVDLIGRVSAQLDLEDNARSAVSPVEAVSNESEQSSRSTVWAPLAIAASVMFAVILGVETWWDPVSGDSVQAVASADKAQKDASSPGQLSEAEYEARLQALLVKHAGTALSQEGGVAPMARLTSYQASQK